MKEMFTITISEEVLKEFRKVSYEKAINMSLLIQHFLERWLTENSSSVSEEKVDG